MTASFHHKSLSNCRQSCFLASDDQTTKNSLILQFKRKLRAMRHSFNSSRGLNSSKYGILLLWHFSLHTCMNARIKEAFSVIGNWKLLPWKLFSHSFWKSSLCLSSIKWVKRELHLMISGREEKSFLRAMQQNTNSVAAAGEKCQLQ